MNPTPTEAAREIAQKLIPEQSFLDALPEQPTPWTEDLREAGLANWWLAPEWGGRGLSLEESVELVSELSYGDAGFAFGSFLPILATTMIDRFAPAGLREQWLATLGGEGASCAVLVSEDDSGSELTRMTTTARREGDELVVHGEKMFSTNTDAARLLLVAVRPEDDEDTTLIAVVPRETPGVEITGRWSMIGMRGSGTYRVRLDDVRVPAGHVLRGQGIRVLEVGLNASRTLIAATAIGIGRRIRDVCLEYASTKKVKGQLLSENAVFMAKLGQMEMQIEVMKSQCRRAAAEFDALLAGPHKDLYRAGALRSSLSAKMFCGQAGWEIATAGSAMFGGLGYTNDHVIGKLVRDMRYVGLVEGGDDVVRDLLYGRYVVPAARRG